MAEKKGVVVTTSHRGVFFGYLTGARKDAKTLHLKQARMCIYWSADVRGVLGLASSGPSTRCKVGPAVPSITLQDVTAVIDASPEATEKWEKGPWQ